MIDGLMALPEPDDGELAQLHLILCLCLLGSHDCEAAGEKADVAQFLARKLKDGQLLEEALYRSGTSYGRAGQYRTAIRRFTDCVQCSTEFHRGDAFFGRGLCYDVLGAYSFAIRDYEEAIRLASASNPVLARKARLNLAWVFILRRDFPQAEGVLAQLASETEAAVEQSVQLQIAHDRVHMAHLKGEGRNAFAQALFILREAGDDYPHIRAHTAITLMALAGVSEAEQDAFTLGTLGKRLAALADRPDLDEDASREMQSLERRAGTDCLAQSLLKMRQVLPGALKAQKMTRGTQQTRGVR